MVFAIGSPFFWLEFLKNLPFGIVEFLVGVHFRCPLRQSCSHTRCFLEKAWTVAIFVLRTEPCRNKLFVTFHVFQKGYFVTLHKVLHSCVFPFWHFWRRIKIRCTKRIHREQQRYTVRSHLAGQASELSRASLAACCGTIPTQHVFNFDIVSLLLQFVP